MSSVTNHSLTGYADREEPVGLDQKKCSISSGTGDQEKKEKKKRKIFHR
jgi:hypothetical protein